MISNAENENEILSGLRKAAMTVVALGDDAAAAVFRLLDEDEVQRISREISKIDRLVPEQTEAVLGEFHEMSLAHEYLTSGGIEYAKRVLNSAFGPDRARNIIEGDIRKLGGIESRMTASKLAHRATGPCTSLPNEEPHNDNANEKPWQCLNEDQHVRAGTSQDTERDLLIGILLVPAVDVGADVL